MNEKKLTELYIEEIENSAPDFDVMWQKIEANLEPKTQPINITPKKNGLKAMVAVAAMIMIIPVAVAIIESNNIPMQESTADVQQTQAAENTTAEEAADDYYNDAAAEEAPETNKPDKKLSYSDLQFSSYSTTYLTCSEAPYGDDYFVEEDILGEADYIVKGEILKAYTSENGAGICYEMEISGSYPEVGVDTIIIETRSPYTMKRGREYLIPIKETTFGYRTVFDHIPQIEFTADGGMVYYNGWSISGGENLLYPRTSEADFYDRMMYSYSGDYSELIDKFMNIKAT